MMDYTHEFEELPVVIGNIQVMECTGRAQLEADPDFNGGAYGFIVIGIELDGHLFKGSWLDGRQVMISERSDDPFMVELFKRLSNALRKDEDANTDFQKAFAEYQREAA